ncbi:MAG: 16S rRNA (guanine(527)-N(7))-methyltransferase RsmG [Oscillospiraceae bacterium]|nr:16S rRNA (guanine(527)-N(7))-methyltransferase RsmG [Oscillospiraceae bacterium]
MNNTFQAKVEKYISCLCEWNSRMNLTAVRDPQEIRIRHFEDSIKLSEAGNFPGKRVLDIGSGAGFPGLVLAMKYPDIHMTVMDSAGKKVEFMRHICKTLAINNAECHQGRAEELAHRDDWRETFDIVTSRGLAALGVLCEICLPFLKIGGLMLAMKSSRDAFDKASLLGGELLPHYNYTLSNGLEHYVVRFRKIFTSPEKFPRPWAQIKRKTLYIS